MDLELGLDASRGRDRANFLIAMRLAEQIALDQVETHVVRGEKIGAGLDALRNGARAVVVGQLDDPAAYRLFQPVIRAAVDELMVDLQLDERKASEAPSGMAIPRRHCRS